MNTETKKLAVLVVGSVCVSLALDLGVGVTFGWWGLLFWAGIGLILAWVKA